MGRGEGRVSTAETAETQEQRGILVPARPREEEGRGGRVDRLQIEADVRSGRPVAVFFLEIDRLRFPETQKVLRDEEGWSET